MKKNAGQTNVLVFLMMGHTVQRISIVFPTTAVKMVNVESAANMNTVIDSPTRLAWVELVLVQDMLV